MHRPGVANSSSITKEFALEAENQSHSYVRLHPKIKALTHGAQNTFSDTVYSLAPYGKTEKWPLLDVSFELSIPLLLRRTSWDMGSSHLEQDRFKRIRWRRVLPHSVSCTAPAVMCWVEET